MLSLLQREPVAPSDPAPELPPFAHLPRLDLGAEREPWWRAFGTSLRDCVSGPSPSKDAQPSAEDLRVDWIDGKVPGRAFAASCVWHVAFIWVLLLPIWGFLHSPAPTLAPVQIEVTYYTPPEDLPQISLPAPARKPAAAPRKITQPDKPPAPPAPDAYNPRQTILSVPVHVTHPRQTLIQPDAPPMPPKVVPQLPNIVQWTAADPPKPRLEISPTTSAPKIRQREIRDTAAPQIADKNSEPLAIIPAPIANPQLQVPVSAASAPVAQQHRKQDVAPAPEIAAGPDDGNLRRLIALSATPAPPAPTVSVPQGNLAARISMSPEGKKSVGTGASGGSPAAAGAGAHGAGSATATATLGAGSAGKGEPTGGSGSLPAAVSVSGGERRAAPEAAYPLHRRLILTPTAPAEPASQPSRGPMNVAGMDPEMILSGKEVYTLNVNLPNLTSVSGSWILNFAQLDEDNRPGFRPKGRLAAPQPYEKVDPKYPSDAINQHIDGEVILYAIIRKDGSVDSIQVVHGIDPQLDHNAIEALSRWKFRPASREGVPVDIEAVVHIPFRFRSPAE
jgi:TonB family protein